MTDNMAWTIYTIIEPVHGEQSFNVVIDDIEVGQAS